MLKNVDIHTACPCYQTGDEQTISAKEFSRGDENLDVLTYHCIVFVRFGAVQYDIEDLSGASVVVRSGEMVFFPACSRLTSKSLEDSAVVMFKLSEMVGKIPECNTFRFQRVSDRSQVPETAGAPIHVLTANDQILHMADGLVRTELDGLKCSSYAQLIVGQLLFLIQAYYAKEEYLRFYSTVASPDASFHDFIREKHIQYRTINEFADVLGMSTQKFARRFRKVFGEKPHKWLGRKRSEYIYHQLCSSNTTIREIAAEHGFSPENFTRYCRMNYGTTPGALRSELVSSPNEPQEEEQDQVLKCKL